MPSPRPSTTFAPPWGAADGHPTTTRDARSTASRDGSPGGTYDVVVVGAGIVGLTVAGELAASGAQVVVLEAESEPGRGVTGQSTAKVTTGHALRLSTVRRRHGDEVAREYATAASAGLEHVRRTAVDLDVPWRRDVPHDLYTTDRSAVDTLAQHAVDAQECGLTVTVPDPSTVGTPVPAARVVRYPDQLLIDPVEYCRALADRARDAGVRMALRTTASGLDEGSPSTVPTSAGDVRAQHVVLATGIPYPHRTLAFAVVEQERHYAVAGTTDVDVPTTYDVSLGWSTRPATLHVDGERRPGAVVVGPGHPTGSGDPTAAMHRLRVWAQDHLRLDVTHEWSTQDAFPADDLPLVGRAGIRRDVWIATGFAAWGLTLGTAAALDIARCIAGGASAVPSWQPRRPGLAAHPKQTLVVSAKTAANLGGSLLPRTTRSVDEAVADLGPGQGAVVQSGRHHVAVSRDRDGVVRAGSGRCTHLGCLVSWNAEAESWDCPCHGSRFGADGAVRHGPALEPLAPRDVTQPSRESDVAHAYPRDVGPTSAQQ